ncbi:MAG: VapC toxin family PIN domain ribonuclease [Rubrivivax sp.]|nr:VapC toxin family PIN domain ribonuclease [Rubrivivax sp.]
MTTFLLDVNVLIALVDPTHVQHEEAHAWFARVGRKSFATCPLTENGLVRIVGHPKYPNSPGPPSVVMHALTAIRGLPGHVFWPDSVSIAEPGFLASALLSSHARVTDSYLLALARANRGLLATMDQRLASEVVPEGKDFLQLL